MLEHKKIHKSKGTIAKAEMFTADLLHKMWTNYCCCQNMIIYREHSHHAQHYKQSIYLHVV